MARKAKVKPIVKPIVKRPAPTAQDFVRMMEAMGAYELNGEAKDPWGKVYRMAHVCFESVPRIEGGCCSTCSHPEWVKEFWETYDCVKGYWGEKGEGA